MVILILIFAIAPARVALSQEASNQTDSQVLSKILDRQLEIERSLGDLSAANDQNADETAVVESSFNDRISALQNRIEEIERESRLLNYVTISVTVIAVVVSGYVGFWIHKREYNAELAETHFVEIKSAILAPYSEFVNKLKSWSTPEENKPFPSRQDIITTRSLDAAWLRMWKEDGRNLPQHTLNVQLWKDVVENHYPEVKSQHDRCVYLLDEANKTAKEVVKDTANLLRPVVENQCSVVTWEEIQKLGFKSDGRNLIVLGIFAQQLALLAIDGRSESEYEIGEVNNGSSLTFPTANGNTEHIMLPRANEKEACKSLIRECLHLFYSDSALTTKVTRVRKSFDDFQKAVDDLGLELDKISSKTVLRTKRRYLFFHSCSYIKP